MELTDYSSLFKKVCKCKCHKLFRYKSLLENHYYIYEYEFKNNVIIFESERKLLKTSQLPCFIRIDCIRKIKETSTEKRQNSKRTSQTHIFQDICISAVLFTAIIVSISHRLYMSPLKVLRCKYFYFPQKWMKLEPFTSEILILLLKAFAVGYSSSHLISFYSNNESVDWNLTETKLDFCNLPSNYWKRKFKNNINLLNFKQIPSSTNIYYQNCNPKASFDFLMKVFEYVIQEIIRYLNEYLNRMRRKTQFILTILMLLQLLTTVSLTHCTTSSNQTREKIISTPSSFTSPILPEHMRAQLKQTFAFTSTTQSPLHTNSGSIETTDFKDQEEQVSARVISNRLSGGSSITNFFQQENNSKRDYNPYFASVGCYSCQKREQVKADTLESIKKHILLRLEMQTLPNITAPSVPYTIIENFYRNFSYLSHKKSIFINEKNNDSKNNNSTYATPSIHLNQQTNNTEIPIHIDNRMQGDDPNIYSKENKILLEEYNKKSEQLSTDIMEEEFYSTVNSVYVFPTTPRMRHNRKAEILNFKFKNNEYSTVSQALLYVYIRGRDWIRENEPDLLKINNSIAVDRQDIKITINRVVRRFNSTLATHTINVTESKHRIPNGIGEWISIDVTQLVQDWLQNATTNQGIIIKSYESWMKPLINTGDSQNNKAFTVYIEILTKDNRKRRAKRNTSMNCSETDNEERCCRYPLVVNFEEFDWTWVVAPTSFNAYFCNGECKLGFLEKYPHTHLMQLSTAPQPCCSPTKMSPLLLLYFNTENTLVMSTIPNMAVEKCSCS